MSVNQPYFIVSSAQREKKLSLDSGSSWTIGRDAQNVFVLEDDAVSRWHAIVQQIQPGKFYFIDLGSSNGSTLNGRRIITAAELRDGDSLVCGNTTLVFRRPQGDSHTIQPDSAHHHSTVLLHSERLITVLVIDIRDFTLLARRINEAQLARSMGTWFRELGSMFRRSGCATDKYIGDAAMAVWVHESKIPDQQQISQVLETLLRVRQFTATLHEQFSLPAPVRIGAAINTGLSVMGNTGPQENPDFSPLGDTVNTAFRLESATKQYGFDVALGRLAFECLSGAPNAEQFFAKRVVELKGYEGGVETWLTTYPKLETFLASGQVAKG